MESIRALPRKLYWLVSGLLELLLLYFLSIIKVSKPTGSLTRDDIRKIRRGEGTS